MKTFKLAIILLGSGFILASCASHRPNAGKLPPQEFSPNNPGNLHSRPFAT